MMIKLWMLNAIGFLPVVITILNGITFVHFGGGSFGGAGVGR